MKYLWIAVLVLGVANAAMANSCLFVDSLQNHEWTPEPGSVFPNSICIFPDGRTGLNNAVHPVSMIFAALYAPWGGTSGCDWHFTGQAMNFGHSGAGVVLCGGGAVYAPCESLPCSFNWYGIAGGGHSPVDAQGHPLGMTEVVWTPSTCDHGCSPVQIELYVNSPDINGDLLVNLSDLPLFSADLSSYNFRSDFNFDGVVNLNDLAIFTSGFGAVCGAN